MLIDLVLPYPPTVNTYWRRRGSTYFISEEGKRYRRAVALIVRQQRLKLNLSGRLAIKVIAEPPDNWSHNYANYWREMCDIFKNLDTESLICTVKMRSQQKATFSRRDIAKVN